MKWSVSAWLGSPEGKEMFEARARISERFMFITCGEAGTGAP